MSSCLSQRHAVLAQTCVPEWEKLLLENVHVSTWDVTHSHTCLVTKLQSVMLEENRVRSPPTRSYALQAIQASNNAGQAQTHDCTSRSL